VGPHKLRPKPGCFVLTPQPELSIVVVLYNSVDELDACLQSVRVDVESGWAELLLVDNASPDDSAAIGVRAIPTARLLTLPQNRGFAGGVNEALAEARGRYILLLNPDVVVPPGGLREMLAWMKRSPSVGAASPDVVTPSGSTEGPANAFPSIGRTMLELSRLHRLLPSRSRSAIMLGAYWDRQETLRVGWVPGTAMFVRADVVRHVGHLSDSMFMYGEDIEWCWRIRNGGYQIGVNPQVAVSHAGSTSSIRSWGELEKGRKVVAGIHQASKIMYGSSHARLLATARAGSLAIDARLPHRDAAQRERAKNGSRVWLEFARRG
jgi:GT2 family glycosyltransferase